MEWRSGDATWNPPRSERGPSGSAGQAAAQGESADQARETPGKRRRRRFAGQQVCQVQGCPEPLESPYHKKYKICPIHLHIGSIVLEGSRARFCQKCGHFQPLPDFEGERKSCRAALERHSLRQRLRKAKVEAGRHPVPPLQPTGGGAGSGGGTGSSGGSGGGTSTPSASLFSSNDGSARQQQQQPASGSASPPPLPPQPSQVHQVQQVQQVQQAPLPDPSLSGHREGEAAASMPPSAAAAAAGAAPGEAALPAGSTPGSASGEAGRERAGDAVLAVPQAADVLLTAPQAAAAAGPGGGTAAGPSAAPGAAPEPAPERYVSPAQLYRLSLKIFGCTPDMLAPDILRELLASLAIFPELVEAAVRPGCTHLTLDLRLRGAEAALASTPAVQLLQALRAPPAASRVLLQWQGQVAWAAAGGGAAAAAAPGSLAEPRLQVQPACIAAPAAGLPWPLVRLQLLGGTRAAGPPVALCRQAGRHLPVEAWGESEAAAAAGLAAARAAALAAGSSGSGSGSSSDSNGEEELPAAALAAPQEAAAVPPAIQPASRPWQQWVRPVGLCPGSCELEVQLPLAGAAAAAAGGDGGVLLSSPAPLLVLQDAAAAAEVQRLVQCSGGPGAQALDNLLRDVGLAAALLEEGREQGADEPAAPPLPPAVVAAAACAAAGFAQRHGMPSLQRLLLTAAAAAGSATPAQPPASEQDEELSAALSLEVAKGKAEEGDQGPLLSDRQQAALLSSQAARRTECMKRDVESLEVQEWPGARGAARGALAGPRLQRLCAALLALFLALLLVRLLL